MARQVLNLGSPTRGLNQPGGDNRFECFRKTDENFEDLYALVAAALLRANHTGTQEQSTIVNLVSDLAAKATPADITVAVNAAKIEAIPQFEVAASTTRALTRESDQGATIILAGAGASVSFDAAAQGNGFLCTIVNETGSDWLVPAFANATSRYSKGAAHTKIENGGGAAFEVATWGGTRYVRISGDTI